ncbi:hypothetical protein FS815_27535 [Agrobacterium vitis]|uniref:hypothetical protein n=1 Tax=Allorhizobium ampelinum TaxID=3025782 RepID=UPI001F28A776|nr:hypothetical protein [Allorhizobium ampelinum]MCF1450529.1 hypothetical protein [Allorhizobium ampelinum]
MNDVAPNYYERRLQREIEEIEARIRELTNDKAALQRQLMKARRESVPLSDVHRKNSVTRVMIESRIVDALRSAPGPLSAKELLFEAMHVDFLLKASTFRTHLHRMKKKGLIQTVGKRGFWTLPAT